MAFKWLTWRRNPPLDERQLEENVSRIRQTAPVPSLWLFGKTGSGKTSVIHYLTGAEEAIIGEGFRPETKTSRRFDFPDSIDPLLRFLDTRGLAEARYDPTDDIQQFSQSTQMMIVTVRVTDHALSNLITPLKAIRRATPEMPVLLVLTCLHEALGSTDLTEGRTRFKRPVIEHRQQKQAEWKQLMRALYRKRSIGLSLKSLRNSMACSMRSFQLI